mgnify:CR=1 FL=1
MKIIERNVDDEERGDTPASYFSWLCGIVRRSLETLTMEQMLPYDHILRKVFQAITYQWGDGRYFSSRYDRAAVEANIRKPSATAAPLRQRRSASPSRPTC